MRDQAIRLVLPLLGAAVISYGCSGKAPYSMTDGGPAVPAEKGRTNAYSFEVSSERAGLPLAFEPILGTWTVGRDGTSTSWPNTAPV